MAKKYFVTHSDMVGVADAIRERIDSTEVLKFPDGWIDALNSLSNGYPDFVTAEASRAARVVRQRQSVDTFSFLAITDAHWLDNAKAVNSDQMYIPTSIKHAGMGMNEIKKLVDYDINLGVVLGDNGWGAQGSTTVEEGIQEITATNKAIAKAFTGIPNLRTHGNHCTLANGYTANGNPYLDSEKLYELYGSYNTNATFQAGNEDRGYCYQDFPKHKLRVICMNTADIKGLDLTSVAFQYSVFVSSTQLNWLASVLDMSSKGNDAENWRIIIVSHHPLDFATAINSCNILKSYLEGTTYSGTNSVDGGTYSCDFSKGNNKAKIIANIHGHNHNYAVAPLRYYVGNSTTAQLPAEINRICIRNACFVRNNERAEPTHKNDSHDIDYGEYNSDGSILYANKTKDTGTDTSFAVVTIDSNNIIYVAYYGARPVDEKVIPYGDVVRYTITNSLTNVITNNTSGTTLEGISYSATLTVNSGCELKSITVTMGGTDITSSCYSNGVVSIPTVTGNIVITARAEEKVVVNLLDVSKRTASTEATQYIQPTEPHEIDYAKWYGANIRGYRGSYARGKITYTDNSANGGFTYKASSDSGYGVEFPVDVEGSKTYVLNFKEKGLRNDVYLFEYDSSNVSTAITLLKTNSGGTTNYDIPVTLEFTATAGRKYAIVFVALVANTESQITELSLTEK